MDHVELINRIIEAEQQAQQMAEEARAKQTHLQDDLKQNASAMRQGYFDQAENRIRLVREQEENSTKEKLEALETLSRVELESMRALFREHREEWVDTIFRKIVE